MSAAAQAIGWILLIAGFLVICAGLTGIFLKEGFAGLQEVMSPFNVLQWLAVLITLAPGMFFIWLSDWLAKRKRS